MSCYDNLRANISESYFKKFKIMIILRGLPGSGKSTLAHSLAESLENTIVCSADDFFLTSSGNYEFDETKREEAHKTCHEKARNACISSNNVVIDNTNIRKWETKYYISLAMEYNYVAMILEPDTPWKKDTEELSKRNKHKVLKETIEKKLNMFEIIRPVYYGWFCNIEDSLHLKNLCEKFFDNVKQFEQTKKKWQDNVQFLDVYNRSKSSEILHCTAKFLGKTKSDITAYEKKADNYIGKLFQMRISGLLLTNNTASAKVELTDKQKEIWDDTDCCQNGSRAHITLGYIEEKGAVQAGPDMSSLVGLRKSNKIGITSKTFDNGIITVYNNDFYFFEFEKSIMIKTIFAARY